MARMDSTTQARKTRASLFTYLTPTKTTTAMRASVQEPYTLMLCSRAAASPSGVSAWNTAAPGEMYVRKISMVPRMYMAPAKVVPR